MRKILVNLIPIFFLLLMGGYEDGFGQGELNPNSPNHPVRLVFIHHSTGENWLSDENGGLGIALRDNNYYVSDTNYGWGPDQIGDDTDIGHWWLWFRGPDSSTYLNALYNEEHQNCSYSRLSTAPLGENEIILFKSCFPNSALRGNPNDPVPSIDNNPLRGEDSGSDYHTVANAKGIYIDLLEYFRTRQDKLFIVITAPPLSDPEYAANARAFNQWLVNDWLDDYPFDNVFVFDFYNVLTTNGGNPNRNDLGREAGNHHRWWNNMVQHQTDGGSNVLAYRSSPGDDHPSQAGNLKATGEFMNLLNVAYNLWKGEMPLETVSVPSIPNGPTSGTTGAGYAYSTGGSFSSLGHAIEYQFDWKGDGTDLSSWGSAMQAKTWTSPDTYNVRARARCAADTFAVSGWSNILTVTIGTAEADLTGSWKNLTQTCRGTRRSQICRITGVFTISNIGDKKARSTYVDFYLSDDDTYQEEDSSLKRSSTGKMKAHVSRDIKLIKTLPLGQTATGKYIISVIDKNDSVAEIDETNNIVVIGPIQ